MHFPSNLLACCRPMKTPVISTRLTHEARSEMKKSARSFLASLEKIENSANRQSIHLDHHFHACKDRAGMLIKHVRQSDIELAKIHFENLSRSSERFFSHFDFHNKHVRLAKNEIRFMKEYLTAAEQAKLALNEVKRSREGCLTRQPRQTHGWFKHGPRARQDGVAHGASARDVQEVFRRHFSSSTMVAHPHPAICAIDTSYTAARAGTFTSHRLI